MAGKGNRIKQKRISYEGRGRLLKRENTWTFTTAPGAHSKGKSVTIGVLLRDILKIADNTKEVKYILNNKSVLVNNIRTKNTRFGVGLFDVVEFKDLAKKYRLIYDSKGFAKMMALDKKDGVVRYCKIMAKKTLSTSKFQVSLDNGHNIVVDKDSYKVKDSVVFDYESNKITEVLHYKAGSSVYIAFGPHVGKVGVIKSIISGNVGKNEELVLSSNEGEFRTVSKYAYIVPKNFSVN